MAGSRTYRAQVLERAFQILDCLGENGSELGVTELASRAGLNKSTVHRLLMVLERHHYVAQSTPTGKYRLGVRLYELGVRASSQRELVEVARPHLTYLVTETRETAHLGILSHGEVLSVYAVESPRTLRTPSTVGRRTPAHCSSLGKAMLAFRPQQEVDGFVRARGMEVYTCKTIRTREGLESDLQRVRERGYSIDDEEWEEGLKCIGAPIRDESDQVVAAVSIAGPAARLRGRSMGRLTELVIRVANEISVALGYQSR